MNNTSNNQHAAHNLVLRQCVKQAGGVSHGQLTHPCCVLLSSMTLLGRTPHLAMHLEVFEWKMRVLALSIVLFIWMSMQPKSGLLVTAQGGSQIILSNVCCIKFLFHFQHGLCLNQILGTEVTTGYISFARTEMEQNLKTILQSSIYFLPVRTIFKDGFWYYGSSASVNRV